MIWLPSRSGRIASQLLLLLAARRSAPPDRRTSADSARRLALVAGRAVGAGQLVQPRQQRPGVARRSGARPSRSTRRRRSRGSAGAARPAGRRPSTWSLEYSARPSEPLGRAWRPTISWWWKDTRPPASNRRVAGLPMSCSSAASRSTDPVGTAVRPLQVDRLLQHGERVLVDVLVPVVLVALQPQRRQLGQHQSASPVSTSSRRPSRGSVGEDQLGQLVPDPLGGDDREPRRPSPSSRPRTSGRDLEARAGRRTAPPAASAAGRRRRTPPGVAGVRSTRAARSPQAAVGVDELRGRAAAPPSR